MKAFRLTLVATFAAAILAGPAARAQAPYVDQRQGAYLDTGGDRIFYQVTGKGPAMLLIHGFPLSGALFEKQRTALSQSFTVVTPDLPGFGKSSTGTIAQTETHYAQDLFALLDHLGVRRAIVGGHSMGGQVTLEMYRQQPSRLSGMILFDTNAAPASIVEQAQWPAYGLQARQLGAASIAPSVVGVMITGGGLIAHPELGTTIAGIVSEATPDGVQGGGNALATRRDYRALVPAIQVPLLIVEGLDDTVYPYPVSAMLKQAMPASVFSVISGAGHASMFEHASVANASIVYWAVKSGLGGY